MKCTHNSVCIYYREIFNKNGNLSTKIVCDYRDGEEIKNIPAEEIKNCEHYKPFNEIKWKI
jgi:hypothetical protein